MPPCRAPPGDEKDLGPDAYGARKAACEQIVVDGFGDRGLVVRPGLIVGPHDRPVASPTGRIASLAAARPRAGSPDDPVQFIDVRDLARWMVRAATNGVAGVTTRPARRWHRRPAPRVHSRHGERRRLAWVASDRLLDPGVEEWMGVPLWIVSPGWEAANRVPVDNAIAAGLTFRPLAETVRGALEQADTTDAAGLAPEREAELLAEWHRLG